MVDIIEHDSMYDKDIKDLFVELQEYIASIDKEKYNILTKEYREECFKDNMLEIKENNGKILLAREKNKIIGLIIGIINEEENTYDFKAPKRGRITELIITKNYRSNGLGELLLKAMEKHLIESGCKAILIEVFGYNEIAKGFYSKHGYNNRLIDVIKTLE